MDYEIAKAVAVLIEALKDPKLSEHHSDKLMKLHGKIESRFPELQPDAMYIGRKEP